MQYLPATGLREDIKDKRDLPYMDVVGAGELDLDWEAGHDAFAEVGLKPIIQDQGRSLSCVGQSVKQNFRRHLFRLSGNSSELSAAFVYAQIRLPEGGASLRDGMRIGADQGMVLASAFSDYENGNPPTEQFMINALAKITASLQSQAKRFDNFSYRVIEGFTTDINAYAHAVQYNLGFVGGFTMSNGGWMQPVVRPPLPGETAEGHAVDICAFGELDLDIGSTPKGTKCLFTANSWGGRYTIQEGRWKGYQAIPESYFTPGEFVFRGWVFVPDDQLSIQQKVMDFLKVNEGKLVMDSGPGRSGTIGLVKGGKILIPRPDRVALMVANYIVQKEGAGATPEVWDNALKDNF